MKLIFDAKIQAQIISFYSRNGGLGKTFLILTKIKKYFHACEIRYRHQISPIFECLISSVWICWEKKH